MTEKLLVPDIGELEGDAVIETIVQEGKEIKQNKNRGCATLCIGGGMGIAICIEKT